MTTAWEQRLRCADPTVRELLEAQIEVRADRISHRDANPANGVRVGWRSADGVTVRTHNFPSGNSLTAAGQSTAVTLSNAPAGNNLYEAHYNITITPDAPPSGENLHEVQVVLETSPDGSAWTEREKTIYQLTRRVGEKDGEPVPMAKHDRMFARVAGLTSAAQIRLRIAAATMPGTATFSVHGFNTADGDPRDEVGNPSPNPVAGVEYHTGAQLDFPEAGGVIV